MRIFRRAIRITVLCLLLNIGLNTCCAASLAVMCSMFQERVAPVCVCVCNFSCWTSHQPKWSAKLALKQWVAFTVFAGCRFRVHSIDWCNAADSLPNVLEQRILWVNFVVKNCSHFSVAKKLLRFLHGTRSFVWNNHLIERNAQCTGVPVCIMISLHYESFSFVHFTSPSYSFPPRAHFIPRKFTPVQWRHHLSFIPF